MPKGISLPYFYGNFKLSGLSVVFALSFFFGTAFFLLAGARPVEAAAPAISGVFVSNITSQGATVFWTTDVPSSSLVDFGLTTAYGTTVGDPDELVTSHTVILVGLLPSSVHHFRVRSSNNDGESVVAGYTVTTTAAPVISDVRLESVTNNQAVISFQTDIDSYPLVAYGLTDAYGSLVGDEENFGRTHNITISGLTPGKRYFYKPRVSDVYGNYTFYSGSDTFTTSGPYLESFSTTKTDGVYGPGSQIQIVATFQEPVVSGQANVTVTLNTGVSLDLNQVSGNTVSGTYVVGATGSGQNASALSVSEITYQNVCDSDGFCYRGTTLPLENIGYASSVAVDTTAPTFSNLRPLQQWPWAFNSITTGSDISYTVSESLSSGSITFFRTGGTVDSGAPHVCTLTGDALVVGAHNAFNLNACSEGVPTLANGTTYTIRFQGEDPHGNDAIVSELSGMRYDTSVPSLQSFTTSTPDGVYGVGNSITILADFSEGVSGSMKALLDTGVEVTLSYDSDSGRVRGIYTVGDIGSGQFSEDLTVSQITYMNVSDWAGNTLTSTDMSGISGENLGDNADIEVDTTIADMPTIEFVTESVNLATQSNVTLRVGGDPGTTIHYSIDDANGGTPAVTGSLPMEADGLTDISGIDLSGLGQGTLTGQARLEKVNGTFSTFASDTILKDTVRPVWWHAQYYADYDFHTFVGYNPRLSPGTYYVKLTFSEGLDPEVVPNITIDAQGTNNDVSGVPIERVGSSTYRYTRTIVTDPAADGSIREDMFLDTLRDTRGNDSLPNISATYEYNEAAFTDTFSPTVTGSVNPSYASAGFADVSLTFSESMDMTVPPTVRIRTNSGSFLDVSGSYQSATTWSGSVELLDGHSNGPAALQVSVAEDVAGNVMEYDESVYGLFIDTVKPTISTNIGTDAGPVKTDEINLSAYDPNPGSGLVTRRYGFSSDSVCNESDVYEYTFVDGESFSITGDETRHLCAKAVDRSGNTTYQLIGPNRLNVDNTAPSVYSVTSDTTNGSYKAGDVVQIRVNFTENVKSTGPITVLLETGAIDRSCTFGISDSDNGICEYVVQAGDASSDLNEISVSVTGTLTDMAGNILTDFEPAENRTLSANKNIVIDTVAPVVNILSPLQGNSVNGATTVFFTDTEQTVSQCSFDNETWTNCASGSTVLSSIEGWDDLDEGGVSLYLRDTDLAGNIGFDSETGILKDTNFPSVNNVTADKLSGHYGVGTQIPIVVTFSRAVTSTGNVVVTLETGSVDRSCTFAVTNETEGRCTYTVQDGDVSDDLNVLSVAGTITDSIGNALVSPVPIVNLANNKDIVIDTAPPTVSTVTSTHSNGTFYVEEEIDVVVTFSEPVQSDLVTVFLDSGGSCSFTLPTHALSGTCLYAVSSGENSLDLNVTSISGNVSDLANNTMKDFVPGINLSASKNIKIDTTPSGPPTIESVITEKDDGSYTVGEEIPVTVTFSEQVIVVGPVTVTFETGTVDRTCSIEASALNGRTSGSCAYVVQEGDVSSDLHVSSVNGTVYDVVNNLMTDGIPTLNIDDLRNIVIDTVPPAAPTVTLTDPVTDITKTSAVISGNGEPGAQVSYSIDDANLQTSAKTGVGEVSPSGEISISGIDLTGLAGGTLTAVVTLIDPAGNVGTAGTAQARSSVVLPMISSVTSMMPDGQYPLGESIGIQVVFSENVISNGDVTVVLETGATDRSCTFSVSNSMIGTCDYVVQAGDTAADLNVKFVSGSIMDMADNPMVNFSIPSNLADNKNISIDTAPPAAPTVALTDPVTDQNESGVSITGSGEAGTMLSYSIDDTNPATAAKTGEWAVPSDGVVLIEGIDLRGLDGGTLSLSANLMDSAGNISAVGADTATSQVVLPYIESIVSVPAEGDDAYYKAGEEIPVTVNFSEQVTSSGNITLLLETGDDDRECVFSVNNASVGTCAYTVQDGDNTDMLDVVSVSGTIRDQAGNPMIDMVPQANLSADRTIVVDTINVRISGFGSATPDGTYGPESEIDIVATYSEPLRSGSSVTIRLNTGASVTLDTVSDEHTLTGTYRVGVPGCGEGTSDLSVDSVASQNVCDFAGNCLTELAVPSQNIANGSNIAVDAVSPAFSDVLPENSANIDSIRGDSDISYSLSESLVSGEIVITRTAWAEDPGSPHTCVLSGDFLSVGSHEHFDVGSCASGGFDLVEGTVYSFRFTGRDAYGNEAEPVVRTGIAYGLDVVPPSVSSVVIENITSVSATVRWTTDEASNSLVDFGETTTYGNIRGNSSVSVTEHSVSLDGLTPGTEYVLRVRSADMAGNEGTDDNGGSGYGFSTSSIPSIISAEVTDRASEAAMVTWEINEAVYSYIRFGDTESYGRFSGDESTLSETQSVLLKDLQPETIYHYRVYFRDVYGNMGFGEDLMFETTADTSDQAPPVISDITVADASVDSATITWVTDELSDSFVEYGLTDEYGEQYGNTALSTEHSVILPSGLIVGTEYHFRVKSSDLEGNSAASEDDVLTIVAGDGSGGDDGSGSGDGSVDEAVDVTISSLDVSDETSFSVVVSWKTDKPCNGMVSYGLTEDYEMASAEGLTIDSIENFHEEHEIRIAGLLANTKYHYRAISYDSAGNIYVSSDETFSTLQMSTISGVSVSNITLDSATISWETGNPTTSEISYGKTPSYGMTAKDDDVSNTHKMELKDLDPGEEYHFRVEGVGNAVGTILSDDYLFATYPKPEVETQEVKDIKYSEAIVSWKTNVPTDSSVEYVNTENEEDVGVHGSGEVSREHEVRVLGLSEGAEYRFTVKGMDVNKNTFESDSMTMKTKIDTEAPIISNVSNKASLASQKDDIVQAIIHWKTDEPSTSQVLFDVGMGGDAFNQQSREDSELTENHVVVLTNLNPGVIYRFRAVSKDRNGNSTESETFTLLTPQREESVFQMIVSNFEQTFGWMKQM